MHLRRGKTQQQAMGRFLKPAAVGLWLHAQEIASHKPREPFLLQRTAGRSDRHRKQ